MPGVWLWNHETVEQIEASSEPGVFKLRSPRLPIHSLHHCSLDVLRPFPRAGHRPCL